MKRNTPFDCPNCGAQVPAGAAACPECGSDEKTGWNEEGAVYDGAGIEEPREFDYDEWTRKEGLAPRPFPTKQVIIAVIGLILLTVFLLMFLRW